MTTAVEPISTSAASLRVGAQIDTDAFEAIRRRMMLQFCKWDTQVEDVSTLAEFPLIISRDQWKELARDAEQLARETLRMEQRLLDRPDLQRRMGVPRSLRRLLSNGREIDVTPAA